MREEIKRKIKNKRERGITLIALVITIIVLLILAGVSIAMLTGENGILNQAQKAGKQTDKASIIEQVRTDILGKQAENNSGDISVGELKEILDKYFKEVPKENEITEDWLKTAELTANENYGEYKIKVSEIYNGNLKETIITLADIKEEQKKELYGCYVTNYEPSSNESIVIDENTPGKWMIFHMDEEHIYLIASDYITSVPDGKAGGKPNMGGYENYPRGLAFSNILNDYTDEDNDGQIEISEIGMKLNNEYFYVKNYKNDNDAMKAVAYMVDTDVWSGFKSDEADYAIGGPTIEIFFESYNKTHQNSEYPKGRYQAKCIAGYTYGYTISSDGGTSWSQTGTSRSSDEDNLEKDKTYVISNSLDKAYGMWIASPSAFRSEHILYISDTGDIRTNDCGLTGIGIRPLVALKKEVKLRKTGENTYEIVK